MPSRRRSRETALQMTYQWEVAGGTPEKVISEYFEHFGPLGEDGPHPIDPFAVRLFQDVAAHAPELDEVIRRQSSRWSPERMSHVVRCLLRLAISELRSGRTPARVVIDEALEIGKRFDGPKSTAFLNGILESVRRELSEGGKAPARPKRR